MKTVKKTQGGEDEEHVQGAELHVVSHYVPQGVQGLAEEFLIRQILCPRRAEEHHLNSIAFNCWNPISIIFFKKFVISSGQGPLKYILFYL